MAAKDKRNSITENNRRIFDYFTQSSTPTQEEDETMPKRIKSTPDNVNTTQASVDVNTTQASADVNTTSQIPADVNTSQIPADVNTTQASADANTSQIPTDNYSCSLPDCNINSDENTENIQYGKPQNIPSATVDTTTIDTGYTAPPMSKILTDYLGTSTTEFTSLVDPSSDLPRQEERYEFLLDVRDGNKIRKGEDGYDPTTLYIPRRCYDRFTPFEKQFWDIKSQHFDTVIFFKKGKFYELYEDDAVIASRLFDLRIAERVNMKMAGVPESSYETWAARFVAKGYNVGRVDQSENAMGKKLREQNGKKDKIISRELKEIVTTGTAYNPESLGCCFPFYLGVLVQHSICASRSCTGPIHFSMILYDASMNTITTNSFCDSHDCSQLKTVFVHNDIRELITSENISAKWDIRIHTPDKTPVANTKRELFANDEEYTCFTYLYNFMKHLCREDTLESAVVTSMKGSGDFMSLDGSTVTNMDILCNNFDQSENHTLFKAINYCTTPFGQRLLRKWIVTPLKNLDMINQRRRMSEIFTVAGVDASSGGTVHNLVTALKEMGDIERYHGRLSGCNPTFKDLKLFIDSLSKTETALALLKAILPDEYQGINEIHLRSVGNALSSFRAAYEISTTDIVPGNENDELFVLNRQLAGIQDKLQGFLGTQGGHWV